MVIDQITTRTATIWRDGQGVVRVRIAPGAHDTLEDARRSTAAVAELAEGRRVPVLVDMRTMKAQDRAAREHYAESDGPVLAMALVVGSRVTVLMANFFIAVTNTTIPTRMFTDEAEALAWLRAHRG